MIVAEELDADWHKVRVEAAPVAEVYNHTHGWGVMGTGGSTSVNSSWQQLRGAGAAARALLVAAASERLGVEAGTLRTESGFVLHEASGRKLSYGDLAGRAAELTPPEEVPLKDTSAFRLLGRDVKRLEGPDKVTGRARFGMDIGMPGMLTAVVARPPVFGGRVERFDDRGTLAVRGVRAVKQVPSGVAVIADSFWAAKKGRDLLQIEWDDGPNGALSTDGLRQRFRALASTPGAPAEAEGMWQPASRRHPEPSRPSTKCPTWRTPRWNHSTPRSTS